MISHIAVIGAGQMGRGIAHVCALAHYHVQVVDISPHQLAEAQKEIGKNLDRQLHKGAISPSQKEQALNRLRFSEALQEPASVDLVIEAVSENLEVKMRVLRDLAPHLKSTAIVASNTSSLSLTKLATATPCPDRVIGMHFMNPVPVMPLVEVIRGLSTSEGTYTTIEGVIRHLGKTPIVSQDFPGFIVNRILMPMINEAIYAVYEGVASPENIDTAMQLGTHHPMGPLKLADFIGLDTCLSIMQVLHQGFGDDKYRPCPLLVNYVTAGWLGKKTGRGFYTYE